ncbi:MAG: winged helix-turn-helix domain-containing protein, partial [Terriglobia bacterium]
MASPGRPAGAVRFGPFEYNPDAGELRRRGYRIKLLGQPRQLLNLMIKRPGEVVTREEMRARLW